MKKILSAFLCMAVILSFSTVNSFASSKESVNTNLTINSYIEWLESQINTCDRKSSLKTIESNHDSPKIALKKFKSLPKEKQEKFINYLSDYKVNKEIFIALTESCPNKSLENGDIVVKSDFSKQSENTNIKTAFGSPTKISTNTWNKSLSIFNIKIMQLTNWVKYSQDATKIYEVLGGNGAVTISYNPLQQYEWSGKTTYHTDTTATFEADIAFKVGPIKELCIQQYVANTGVNGHVNGKVDGWFDVYD